MREPGCISGRQSSLCGNGSHNESFDPLEPLSLLALRLWCREEDTAFREPDAIAEEVCEEEIARTSISRAECCFPGISSLVRENRCIAPAQTY